MVIVKHRKGESETDSLYEFFRKETIHAGDVLVPYHAIEYVEGQTELGNAERPDPICPGGGGLQDENGTDLENENGTVLEGE